MRAVVFSAVLCATSLQAAGIALTGATVYRSPEAPAIADAALVIQDRQIAGIGPRASVTIPKGTRVLNCSGESIVAGFWNSHVHILTPGLLHVSGTSAVELNGQLDQMLDRWGFTTVFDIASVLDNTIALRHRIENGEIRGPRILTVGEPLWTQPPVYILDFLNANRIDMQVVATPSEAAARVRALAQGGADGIKLFTGSMQGEGKVANMALEMVSAAVAEAHLRHLPVFAHPQNSSGLEVAIAGGGDILAHTAPEFALMSRAEMSFPQILAALTTNPAGRFGYSGRAGRIATGLDADLTVLEGDPAKDITALSRVRLAIRGGRIIYPAN